MKTNPNRANKEDNFRLIRFSLFLSHTSGKMNPYEKPLSTTTPS